MREALPAPVQLRNLVVGLRKFRWDTTETVVMREPTYQISRQISGSQTTTRCRYKQEMSKPLANLALVPADTPVRQLVTAGDKIRPWRLPQFGLDLSGIPGRIEEAIIKLPPGEVGDQAASTGTDEISVTVRVLSSDAYAEWEGQALPPSCFASG